MYQASVSSSYGNVNVRKKRLKHILKNKSRKKTTKAKAKGNTKQIPPLFESSWFWLHLATLDFGKSYDRGAKENK
jgi:hypothetical protein